MDPIPMFIHNTGLVKWKCAFKEVQNVQLQIILRMRIVSPGPLLSIHKFCRMNAIILLADSEGPDQTALMGSLIWAFAARICLKTRFYMAWPICFLFLNDILFISKIMMQHLKAEV